MKAVGIEIAKSHDLGHRLMRGAGGDALVQPRQFASCQIAIQAPQPPWVHPQDSGKDPVGIARGTLDPRLGQPAGRIRTGLRQPHSWADRRAAWSWAVSASMVSPRSPAMIRSSA